jgi:hypothetical protein
MTAKPIERTRNYRLSIELAVLAAEFGRAVPPFSGVSTVQKVSKFMEKDANYKTGRPV